MPVSHDAVAADHAHLLHPLHHPAMHRDPKIWVEGQGATVTDSDGRKYLDGLAGLWNVNVGYGRRELAEAAMAQMSKLAYSSTYAGSTNYPAIELAERLSEVTYPFDQYVFLHERRCGSHRYLDQDGAVLLESAR